MSHANPVEGVLCHRPDWPNRARGDARCNLIHKEPDNFSDASMLCLLSPIVSDAKPRRARA